MRKLFLSFALLLTVGLLHAQTDEQKVKEVLSSYKNALEKLDVKGTDVLFVGQQSNY
jgi:hypothetical protein